ncbi:MAG: phosphotransferase [Armatimonadota bacterium]
MVIMLNDIQRWMTFFHEQVGWPVTSIELHLLRGQQLPSTYRICLQGANAPQSVIAKVYGANHARPAEAEGLVHEWLESAGAPLPRLLWRGITPDNLAIHLTEDLGATHRVYDYDNHAWTSGEIAAVARATALLHAAGMRLDLPQLVREHSWLHLPSSFDGVWLASILRRAHLPPINCSSASIDTLHRLAEVLPEWQRQFGGWQTIIHADIFWGNVAVRHAADTVEATLLDLGAAGIGMPHYDITFLAMRGWLLEDAVNENTLWPATRRQHYQYLRQAIPERTPEEERWQIGYALADLQSSLNWHAHIIPILDKGDQASPQEKQILEWQYKGSLFGDNFIVQCDRLFSATTK